MSVSSAVIVALMIFNCGLLLISLFFWVEDWRRDPDVEVEEA